MGSYDQNHATSASTSTGGGVTTGSIGYTDDAGNTQLAYSTDATICSYIKSIVEAWSRGDSIKFTFETEIVNGTNTIKTLQLHAEKPGDE